LEKCWKASSPLNRKNLAIPEGKSNKTVANSE